MRPTLTLGMYYWNVCISNTVLITVVMCMLVLCLMVVRVNNLLYELIEFVILALSLTLSD